MNLAWLAWLTWLAAAVVLGAQVVAAVMSPAPDHFADLHVYWASVRELVAGHGLYTYAAANGDPFTYPPFAALVLLPVALMRETAAQVLWTTAQVAAVVALAHLTVRAAPRPAWCPEGAWPPAVVALLAASAPVASSIHFGQISLLVTLAGAAALLGPGTARPAGQPDRWAAGWSARWAHHRSDRWAEGWSGVWAGLAAAVKLTPLALLPAITARRRRDGAVAAAAFLAAGAVAWVVLPADSWRYWTSELLHGRYGHESLVGNQSLAGVLARHPLPLPTTAQGSAGSTVSTVSTGWVDLLIGTVIVVVLVVGTWRACRLARRHAMLPAFVVASCTGLLLAPVSWTHHQTPVVLAAVCVGAADRRRTAVLRGVVVLVMTVNLSALPVGAVAATLGPLSPLLTALFAESRFLLIAYLALLASFEQPHPSVGFAASSSSCSTAAGRGTARGAA